MVNIITAAKTAITAYASAVSLAGNSSNPYSIAAAAMAELYHANFTSFTLGSTTVFPDKTFATTAIERNLVKYNQSGLGTDFRYERSRIEAVGRGSAVVWITWRIVPAQPESGEGGKGKTNSYGKGWMFTDVYGFRTSADGQIGAWEWSNADVEYEKLLENYPQFFY
ncbi:hypothetical protein N657DRAFT_651660 [Parathielavia appendiculata]|uniref:Uncharacterized protein n=1 Tax=Parathielavia appendiculata TaxID=2587402 RepID=A0AAN6YZ52_9PEZI|nr:hypothetical protein N657DRAFT_651660 [Parathielavia appendiculata]